MRSRLFPSKLLIGMVLMLGLRAVYTPAQQIPAAPDSVTGQAATTEALRTNVLALSQSGVNFRDYLMPGFPVGYMPSSLRTERSGFEKTSWNSSPNTIQRMEAAFHCNDTPFVDQVRFPLATLWRGRVKLVGFESDVTTANFVLGLPGQGSLHNLSAFGNAFLATHTPPSDQLAGIHMTFSWRGNEVEPGDSSGLRGVEYLVRASRSFLPFLNARPEVLAIVTR